MSWVIVGAGVALFAGCRGLDRAAELSLFPAADPVPSPGSEAFAPGASAADSTLARASFVEPVAPQPDSPLRPSAGPENPIDLGAAFRLAGVDNPTIALAEEAVREALAGQLAARALLLPSINVGANYRLHRGAFITPLGFIRTVDLQGLYVGSGAGALGTNPPVVPGMQLFVHLGDAIYEPLAAAQHVSARQSDSFAVRNAILLRVAAGYLEWIGAEARLAVLKRGESDLAEVVRLTTVHAKAGQGRPADAKRAEANFELLQGEIRRAEEELGVAAARLTGLLSLDPSVRLRSPGGDVQPLRLIPEEANGEALVAEALAARPEVNARSADIAEAQTRVRQERVRPWLPVVSVGYSYGGFGGGSNLSTPEFSSLKGRSDFDVLAVWTLENLGVGNRARVRAASANVGVAIAGYDLATNQIRREVTEALADVQAAAVQMKLAESAVRTSEEGFKLEMDRIQQNFGRPIEVLDSFRQLLDSRQDFLRAVVAYDVAQFRLFVAVGRTPVAAPQ